VQHTVLCQPYHWVHNDVPLSCSPLGCVHKGCSAAQTAAALNRASQPQAVHSDHLHCTLPCCWCRLHAGAGFGGGCLLLCSPLACCARHHIVALCSTNIRARCVGATASCCRLPQDSCAVIAQAFVSLLWVVKAGMHTGMALHKLACVDATTLLRLGAELFVNQLVCTILRYVEQHTYLKKPDADASTMLCAASTSPEEALIWTSVSCCWRHSAVNACQCAAWKSCCIADHM
jgi:hypothetical protein